LVLSNHYINNSSFFSAKIPIWHRFRWNSSFQITGQYFSSSLGKTDKLNITNGSNGTMTVKGTRFGSFIKVQIKNWGTIPEGSPGAGNKPWLFVDEIEVNAPQPLKGIIRNLLKIEDSSR
jgi:hypothetical protein